MLRHDPQVVRAQVEKTLHDCPELADDEVLRADMLEGETDLYSALSSLERDRQEAEALIDALDIVRKNMKLRQGRMVSREEALRKVEFALLQWANLRRVELPEATLSIRAGVGRVIITDEKLVPDELCRIRREPNLTLIRAALDANTEIPGAALSNREETLAIRTK